jgi:hypothetical protein
MKIGIDREIHFLHYKINGAHINVKISRILYLGLELTILDFKNQIHFVRQSLKAGYVKGNLIDSTICTYSCNG